MSIQNYKIIFKHSAVSICIAITVMMLIGGIFFILGKVIKTNAEITTLKNDIADLQSKAKDNVPQSNLSKNEVDEFYNMLSHLIPENEDFFSVLNSIEQISAETGFLVTKYTIDPSKTGDKKISLLIEGIGSPESFLNFVKNYSFSGGRLITSNIVSYEANDTSGTSINLTFYTNKVTDVASDNKVLSAEDVQLLRNIKSKIIIRNNEISEEQANYATKRNPF